MKKDKIKHIIAGALAALVVALPVWLSSNDLFAGLWGCLAGIIAGGVKEWCDNNTEGNEWSWSDFGYTCIGVAIAVVVILAFHFGKG